MKTIAKDELFNHLGDFLKRKGIVLSEGSYAKCIRQGCNLLSDAINATQKTVSRARTGVDKKLTQLRASLHKATSPSAEKPPVVETEPGGQAGGKARRARAKRKAPARKKAVAKKAPAKPKSVRKQASRKKAA